MGYAVIDQNLVTQSWRTVDGPEDLVEGESYTDVRPIEIPIKPGPQYVWNSVSKQWQPDTTKEQAITAEMVRVAGIEADTETINAINWLRNNDADAIKAFVNSNVTDLASAKLIIARIGLVLAQLVRPRIEDL